MNRLIPKETIHRFAIVLAVCLAWLSTDIFAQGAPEQQCPNAISVCQPLYTQANAYTGFGATQELNATNAGCLGSFEKNDVWYVLNTTSGGLLEFTITPNQITDDYDWAVWDVTGQGCQAIYNGLLPIRCNYSGAAGATGMSSTITGPQWEAALAVLPNRTYILNVSQFTASTAGYSLDFSPSTASIYDTVKPKITSVYTKCLTVSDSITLTVSEPIKCNTVAADGSDFYITPAGSNTIAAVGVNCATNVTTTNTITVYFANTIPAGSYWLHVQNGTDGNTVLDNCGNAMTDSVSFALVPPVPPVWTSLDTPACIKARVTLDRGVLCSTIAADGSDFVITGPSNVEVISATFNCDTLGLADTIDLVFDKSIEAPGLYTLSVTVGTDTNAITDSCGQIVVDDIQWYVSDAGGVVATVTPDLVCDPQYIDLLSNTLMDSSAAGYQFKWTPSQLVADSTAANTTAFINQPYTTFQIRITDSAYCYRRDTGGVMLSIRNPQILHTQGDTAFCVGYSIQLEAAGGATYAWTPATGLSCSNCADPVATPLTTTTYTVTITDIYGCSDDLSRDITIYQLPEIEAYRDTTVEYHTPVQLHANAPAGVFYYWEPIIGLNNPNIVNPIAMPEITTVYTVRVADTNRCQNYDSVTIHIVNNKPVAMPNAFSPNGDGKNDIFKIGNVGWQTLNEFRIYNRWGMEVFYTTDIHQGWDGRYKGEPQPIGTYNYIIRLQNPDDKTSQTFRGTITLVR